MTAVALALAVAVLALVAVVVRQRVELAELRRLGRSTALALGLPDPEGPAVPTAAAVGTAAEVAVLRADELAELQERLHLALDAVPEGVVVTDEQGEVVFRNSTAEGYRDARHADALVAAAQAELVADAVGGRAGERTLQLFGPPRRTLVVRATPLAADGRLAGALAVIEDVTERRRLEEVRRDFVANISHELKTPVGAISLLAETAAGEDDPVVARRLAERMVDEAERVGRTIEDLLALTRIETEAAPRRDAVPVAVLVAEAARRIQPAAEQRGVAIAVDEPSPRLAVHGDRRQLVSALYNLLDNAVKYSDDGSTVEVSATTDGRTVDVAVRDHGIGIPSRDLDRVFERFYRVDHARSRRTGGTGLGLAIVRHVVANHDGEVVVASRLGEGSTFTLRLPTASGPVALAGGDRRGDEVREAG